MGRQLLILRHAKSDWGSPSLPDSDRPLNGRGETAATLMGQWMKKQNIGADVILSSPALRARQTIELISQAMQIAEDKIQWEPRLYLASVQTLLEVLTPACEQAARVLVVGHNPGLEELLMYLCGSENLPYTKNGKLLTTANLAQVGMRDDDVPLRSGKCVLRHLWRPREITL